MNSHGSTRLFLAITALAWLLCVLAGPFGTIMVPLPARALIWLVLIGLNAFKWWAWYRWLGPRLPKTPWADMALAGTGAVVLTATLPLEVAWLYRAVGLNAVPDPLGMWLVAAAIALSISLVVAIGSRRHAEPPPQTPPPVRGLALKADLTRLQAITAEDHYLRLHLDGGEKPLLLYRFGDALADLVNADGLQVHRGAWIASRAVAGAQREGRRWWLNLPDGTRLPVSDRHLPTVKARGWLKQSP